MRRKLSDDVRRRIEEEIATGVLTAGAHLDEQMLAARFQVSRTPAREALIALSMAGLVRLVPRRGAVVAGISASDAVSLFEVLVVLEAEAARLAARRMMQSAREQLRAAYESGRPAAQKLSQVDYARANATFHALIYAGANNAYLVQQIKATRNRLRAFRRSGFETANRIRGSFAEHGRVMEAIASGDDAAARDAMIEHISVGGRVFADVVAAMSAADETGQGRGP
jgi:DNA-binding GntR family transcriptional regulator